MVGRGRLLLLRVFGVTQRVRVGRDAYTAWCDQTIGTYRHPSE